MRLYTLTKPLRMAHLRAFTPSIWFTVIEEAEAAAMFVIMKVATETISETRILDLLTGSATVPSALVVNEKVAPSHEA